MLRAETRNLSSVGLSGAATVDSLAALKALSSRPAAVIVATGIATSGLWRWEAGSSTAADDKIVVQCTSGAAGRYKRVFFIYQNVNTTDAAALTWALSSGGNAVMAVEGNNNGYIGVVTNNLAPATPSFPVVYTGIAQVKSAGNIAYPIYTEAKIYTAGIVTSEFAAFQFAGPAPTTYPIDNFLGTTQYISKSLQVTAGTVNVIVTGDIANGSNIVTNIASTAALTVGMVAQDSGLKIPFGAVISAKTATTITLLNPDGSAANATAPAPGASVRCFWAAVTGIDFSPEGSTVGMFNFGMAFRKDGIRLYTMYQDADATEGPLNGIYLAIPGLGTNLILKTAGAAVPTNSVYEHRDAAGTAKSKITQDGTGYFASYSIGSVAFAAMSGTYTTVRGGDGVVAVTIGGSGDRSSYNDNTQHVFRAVLGASTFVTIDTNGIAIASGKVLKVNASQVVGPRDTGWTAMTGSTNKATSYDTTTVTLAQLAGRMMAVQAALTTHGLIGA